MIFCFNAIYIEEKGCNDFFVSLTETKYCDNFSPKGFTYCFFYAIIPKHNCATHRPMEKYPRGRRGSPAKGVVRIERVARVQISLSPPTKKELLFTKSSFFVIQAAGLVWNQRAPRVVWNCDAVAHGIARGAYKIKSLRLDAIHGVAVIPSSPLG